MSWTLYMANSVEQKKVESKEEEYEETGDDVGFSLLDNTCLEHVQLKAEVFKKKINMQI